jgi:hypothetical protein
LKRELLIRFGGTTQSGEEQDNIITEEQKAAGVKGVTQAEKNLGLKAQGTIFPMGGRPTAKGGRGNIMGPGIPTLPGGGIAASRLSGAPPLNPSMSQQLLMKSTEGPSGPPTTNMDYNKSRPSHDPLPQPFGPNFAVQRETPETNYTRSDSSKRRRQISTDLAALQATIQGSAYNLREKTKRERTKREKKMKSEP